MIVLRRKLYSESKVTEEKLKMIDKLNLWIFKKISRGTNERIIKDFEEDPEGYLKSYKRNNKLAVLLSGANLGLLHAGYNDFFKGHPLSQRVIATLISIGTGLGLAYITYVVISGIRDKFVDLDYFAEREVDLRRVALDKMSPAEYSKKWYKKK